MLLAERASGITICTSQWTLFLVEDSTRASARETIIFARVYVALQEIFKFKPSPYSKRWWSKDLDQERRHVHKIGRKARAKIAQRNHPIHEEYRVARNRFSENIKKAKDSHWNEWLESLTETGICNFHRYATSNPADQIHTRIKTPQDPQNGPDAHSNGTQDNVRKSQLLYDTFFRPAPENTLLTPTTNATPQYANSGPSPTSRSKERSIHSLLTRRQAPTESAILYLLKARLCSYHPSDLSFERLST